MLLSAGLRSSLKAGLIVISGFDRFSLRLPPSLPGDLGGVTQSDHSHSVASSVQKCESTLLIAPFRNITSTGSGYA